MQRDQEKKLVELKRAVDSAKEEKIRIESKVKMATEQLYAKYEIKVVDLSDAREKRKKAAASLKTHEDRLATVLEKADKLIRAVESKIDDLS
jgi:hypothetical protein